MKRLLVFIFFLISFCADAQLSRVIPKKPSPPRLVNDFADMLTPEQELALENKLVTYDDTTSNQIAVVTVESLEGYEDEEFALALGREWGVGGSQFNNGIVVLISEQDRKSRIEVGYGLEGAIPDITAKTIIEHDLIPYFREGGEGNYYRGLDRATDALIRAAAGEYKAPPGYNNKGNAKGIGFGAIVIFLILIFLFAAGRKGGGRGGGGMVSRRGYRDFGAGWILGSLIESATRGGSRGGWSGGGGGGGGGGFGGFGGGGFGGGGASGSW